MEAARSRWASKPSAGKSVKIISYALRLILHRHVCRVMDGVERSLWVLVQCSEQRVEVLRCRAGLRHEFEGLADSAG